MSDLKAIESRAFLPGLSWRKRCRACDAMKELSDFYPKRQNRDGLMNICIECSNKESHRYYDANSETVKAYNRAYNEANHDRIRAQQREHYEANRDTIKAKRRAEYEANRDAINAKAREYRAANRDAFNAKRREYRAANRDAILAQRRKWREANLDAIRAQERARRESDPKLQLTENVRRRIRDAFKTRGGSDKARRRWEKLVGYTIEQLMGHLARQFRPRMSWANYGKWHIDHIIPISAFSFTSVDDPEFRACWALSNLRPIWAKENQSKSARRTVLI